MRAPGRASRKRFLISRWANQFRSSVVGTTPQFYLYLGACVLICSGLFHVVVWLIDRGPWDGDVAWRKPILFGLSTGFTVLSIGWLYPKLKPYPFDRILCGLFTSSMVAEVALITVQQWRGVASHFNHATPFDSSVERLMTYLI